MVYTCATMKKINATQQILDKFKSKPQTLIFHGYLTSLKGVELYNEGDSYAFIANNGKFLECGIYSTDMSFVDDFMALFDGCYAEFRMISPQITNHLAPKYNFGYITHCGLFVWNGKPLGYQCSGDLRAMPIEYAHLVAQGTDYASTEDVVELLTMHPSSALFVDNKPVCWCLLHLEKALGMLYTLTEHRKKGYALEVMTDITNKVIAQGDIPYASIVKGNVASENLATKYNLQYVCDVDYISIQFKRQQ